MSDQEHNKQQREPRGLGVHATGLAGEYAREQGWETLEERTTPAIPASGGATYDYGARDFGDTPTDQGAVEPSPEAREYLAGDAEQQAIEEIIVVKEN